MIYGYSAKHDVENATKFFEEMKLNKFAQPDSGTYALMISMTMNKLSDYV
jgi:pentatricopeptide repeat protein